MNESKPSAFELQTIKQNLLALAFPCFLKAQRLASAVTQSADNPS
jgi:hypothetical protein